MGLYNHIEVKKPLPDGFDATGIWFQTKSIEPNFMEYYSIEEDGRLLFNRRENEGSDIFVSGLKNGAEIQWHGYVTFYTIEADDVWRQYRAKFTDGICVEIKLMHREQYKYIREEKYGGIIRQRDMSWKDPDAFHAEDDGINAY